MVFVIISYLGVGAFLGWRMLRPAVLGEIPETFDPETRASLEEERRELGIAGRGPIFEFILLSPGFVAMMLIWPLIVVLMILRSRRDPRLRKRLRDLLLHGRYL